VQARRLEPVERFVLKFIGKMPYAFMEPDFNDLKLFILDNTVVSENELTLNTSVQYDLILYGDDAIECLMKYSERYHVDLSNFMAADYFYGESEVFFSRLVEWLLKKRRKKILTVRHLLKGIRVGKLDEKVITSITN